MKIVGIVAEYNPFHEGHRRHLALTRRAAGECAIVVAMSGNFVQRGDCAITDKWTRAADALHGGADLVLELPTVWAASSAEHFAFGGVSLLRAAGADTLSFGSEGCDPDALARAAAGLDSPEFQALLRQHLDKGLPFALCRQRAADALLGREGAACLSRPNDNLAVEYCKAARRLDYHPALLAIPRAGAGHDGGDHPQYPSASFLREQILSGALPMDDPASLRHNERGVLSLVRRLGEEELAALPDSGEGLARRLYLAARRATTLDELYTLTKTKRYAHARVRRLVLWACLGLEEADRPAAPPYLRVLGANDRGRKVLRALPGDLPVITKPTRGRGIPLLELEGRCTDFYALCRRRPAPCGAEWRTSPVILRQAPARPAGDGR